MAFREIRLTNVPPRTPNVQILFHGQLLLRSKDEQTCEVAVNPFATNHVLTVEVRRKAASRPDLIDMRHIGPLHFRPSEGMLIEVIDPVSSPAAFSCVTDGPIDPETGEGATGIDPLLVEQDFRWVLNLEGPLFHRMQLNPEVFETHHVIRLQGGQYFFRTAHRVSSELEYVRMDGGGIDLTLKRIGAIASASVFLDDEQSVVLRWNDDTQEDERVLTLTKDDNITYEIYIENTPLFLELDPSDDLSRHDELVEYYRVITEIPPRPESRFRLIPRHVAGGEKGSPSIPCQIIRLNGADN